MHTAPHGHLSGLRCDRQVRWLVPLVRAVCRAGLVRSERILALRWLPPSRVPGTWDQPYGSCLPVEESGVHYPGAGGHVVSIATQAPVTTLLRRVEARPLPRIEILDTLAHELAHTEIREHGEAHQALTGAILEVLLVEDRRHMTGTSMLAHESLVGLIEEALGLMGRLLSPLKEHPDAMAEPEALEGYRRFLDKLSEQRPGDQRLADEAWDWIWSERDRDEVTNLQLYGRVAFISFELFHFL